MQSLGRWIRHVAGGISLLAFLHSMRADPAVALNPRAGPPSDATQALARLRVASGLRLSLWAAEPLVQNLTSLSFDEHGQAYAVETGRRRTSVLDIRNYQAWLDDDYALRTVEQRAEFLRGMLNTNRAFRDAAYQGGRGNVKDLTGDGRVDARDLEVETERIRRVWDQDGDGRADYAETFATGFSNIVSGVAAGVLARGSNVWFTSIPDLWLFTTSDPSAKLGTANAKSSSPMTAGRRLHTGFGVHIAYGGHDLHGLILGPDRRLYFSIADRGSQVTNREGQALSFPDTGAVFRCEPDGARLEVYAYGFRNPQELAFDAEGQLWTADNNGDGGDKARLIAVVEGADHGWHIGWQWLPRMGPWNAERLWHTSPSNSAAYLVTPIAHIGHGPAGFAYYPGTGLGAQYDGHFFLADFPGGIRTFALIPRGASWSVVDPGPWMEDNSAANPRGKLLWDLSPVDVTFPPFGGVMVADWVQGWEKTGKGRLWHVTDPALANDPLIAETRRLLSEGMAARSLEQLVNLLSHRDLRIRQEAHFALADRAPIPQLLEWAWAGSNVLTRRHAGWALDIAVRHSGVPAFSTDTIHKLLAEPDATVRRETVRRLGEWRLVGAHDGLIRSLQDPDPHVQAAAWVATAKAGITLPDTAFDSVDWTDPALSQAVIGHLQRITPPARVARYRSHPETHVRIAAVVALRRTHSPEVAEFLHDPDPQVVLEAVRAIHDLPLESVQDQLLAWLESPAPSQMIWRKDLPYTRAEWDGWILTRAIHTALRLGPSAAPAQLARLATQSDLATGLRITALEALGRWSQASSRDRFTGLWRPRPGHDPIPARAALDSVWNRLTNATTPTVIVVSTLQAADSLGSARLPDCLAAWSHHPDPTIRAQIARMNQARQPQSLEAISGRLGTGSLREQQDALAALSLLPASDSVPLLTTWLGRLLDGSAPLELHADILDAAAPLPQLAGARARWTNSWAKNDALAPYRSALAGGDAAQGRRIFSERADLGCQRCHKLRGEGGDVGPDLTRLGRLKGREYVLRALVEPDAEIAAGYESLLVTLKSGDFHAGVVKVDTSEQLVLDTSSEGRLTLKPGDIVSRERSPSPMPAGLVDLLNLRELRDLMAALSE